MAHRRRWWRIALVGYGKTRAQHGSGIAGHGLCSKFILSCFVRACDRSSCSTACAGNQFSDGLLLGAPELKLAEDELEEE